MFTFYFHSDSQHGWLAVKRNILVSLGVLDKISRYSYQRGGTVYLEEDVDAGIVLKALDKEGIKFRIKDAKWCDRSPIRSYSTFF